MMNRSTSKRIASRALSQKTVVVFVLCGLLAAMASSAHAQLTRGHQILLDRGFQIQAWVFPNASVPPAFNLQQFRDANFTTPTFTGTDPLLPNNSGAQWSRVNGSTASTPTFTPTEQAILDDLASMQFLDEQDLDDPAIRQQAIDFLTDTRPLLPNTLLHTNQINSRVSEASMRDYIQRGRPDMLMFDTYPFTSAFGISVPPNNSFSFDPPPFGESDATAYYTDMAFYRRLALEGLTGDGSEPIPYGMFLQTFRDASGGLAFNRFPSESEYRANQFAALTFGYKVLSSFNYSLTPNTTSTFHTMFFDGPGDVNARPELGWATELNRQTLNLATTLVRLLSTDIRLVPGTGNTPPAGLAAWDNTADPFITAITANNPGTANNGNEGDVLVGYFKVLDESFDGGAVDELYFMIQNGLMDPDASAADATQTITILFDFGASGIDSLQRLSRDTGEVETVNLISHGGSLYELELTLEGGTADLFKFNTGAEFVIPEPGSLSLGLSMALAMIIRRRHPPLGRKQSLRF